MYWFFSDFATSSYRAFSAEESWVENTSPSAACASDRNGATLASEVSSRIANSPALDASSALRADASEDLLTVSPPSDSNTTVRVASLLAENCSSDRRTPSYMAV